MKILVTGANGYLGQGIVKQLLDDGQEVLAADFSTQNVDKRAKCFDCNMFDIEDPYKHFEEPDVVLHLAWRNGFIHNADTHMQDLPNHEIFLEKLAKSGVKRLAVMGTMHEIGFFEGAIDENTTCAPQSNYGISKNELRKFTIKICEENNVKLQWLRGYYMVGNVKFGNSIFTKIAVAEEEGKELFPFTTGKNKCDFIDYPDFCIQTAAAVEQDKVLGIINICSGKPVSLAERVEKFIKDNNFKIKLDYGKFPDRPYDSKAVWGNSEKIEKILAKRGK